MDAEKKNYHDLEKSYERLYETVHSIQGMVKQIKVPDAFSHHGNEFLLEEIKNLKKALYEAEHGRLESREGQQEALRIEAKYKARLDEVEQQLHVYRQESEGWKGKYLELQHSHDASNARQEKGQEKLGQLQDQLSSLQESYRELENVHRDLKYQLALADQKLSQSDARASLALREAELEHQMKQEQGKRQCESLQDLLEQKEKAWMQERQVLEKAESLVRDSLQTCEQRRESEAKVMQSKLETLQSEWRSAMEKANEKTTLHHQEVMHWTARHASLTAELNQTAHQLDQLKQEKEQLGNRVNQLSQGLVEEQRKSETILGQKQSIALELAEWKQSLEQARTWWILHVQSDLCPIPNSSSCPFTIPTTSTAANDSSITNWNNAVVEQLDWAKGQFKSKIVEKDEIIARFMETEAALKDQVLLLEKQELALREQVRSLNDNAKFYESRIVSAQGEAQEWKESSQKAQAQVNTLEQAKARLESDLDHEKANWKDQSAAMEAMKLELSRIQEERMEALEKIGHLEAELVREKSLQEVLTGKLKKSQNYSEGLELREQGTFEKIESLCNQVANLESDLKTKHETIDRLIAEQKDLYQQKSEKEQALSEQEMMYKEEIQSFQNQMLQMQDEMQAGIGEYEEKLRQVEFREQDLMMQLVEIQQQNQQQQQQRIRKAEEESKAEPVEGEESERGRSDKKKSRSKTRSRTVSISKTDVVEGRKPRSRSLSVNPVNMTDKPGLQHQENSWVEEVLPPLITAFITQTRLRRVAMTELKSSFYQLHTEYEGSIASIKNAHESEKGQLTRAKEQNESYWKDRNVKLEEELKKGQDSLLAAQKEGIKLASENDQLRIQLKDMDWSIKQNSVFKQTSAPIALQHSQGSAVPQSSFSYRFPPAEQLSLLARQLQKLENLVTSTAIVDSKKRIEDQHYQSFTRYPSSSSMASNAAPNYLRKLEEQVERLNKRVELERRERMTLGNLLRSSRVHSSQPIYSQRKSTLYTHPWL